MFLLPQKLMKVLRYAHNMATTLAICFLCHCYEIRLQGEIGHVVIQAKPAVVVYYRLC